MEPPAQSNGGAMNKTITNTDVVSSDVTLDTQDPVVLRSMHALDDCPVLAAIACWVTKAIKLDSRACRHLYLTSSSQIQSVDVSASGQKFMAALGVVPSP